MSFSHIDQASDNLMYEFHVKELTHVEALRQYADHAVKEIKSVCGWDTEVQIHIEPESKDKKIFSVSMSVFGMGEPVIVKKNGKQVLSVLRKVKKSVVRQIHRLARKKISRRRVFWTEQWAS